MAGITLAQAESKLTAWLDAEEAVASGQSYSIAGRTLTRANLEEIGSRVTYWNDKVIALTKTSGIRKIKVKGITP